MNEQPLYEQTIAARLEQLPVPDLADAIWLRIKDQLDLDLPEGDPPPSPPAPPRPRSTGWKGFGLLAVVAAIVLVYLFNKQNKHSPVPSNFQDTTIHNNPSPAQPNVLPLPRKGRQPATMPATTKPRDSTQAPASNHTVPASSPVDTLLPPPPLAPAANPPTPVKDSIPAKKKKGVQGITDSDYKIIPTQRQ